MDVHVNIRSLLVLKFSRMNLLYASYVWGEKQIDPEGLISWGVLNSFGGRWSTTFTKDSNGLKSIFVDKNVI